MTTQKRNAVIDECAAVPKAEGMDPKATDAYRAAAWHIANCILALKEKEPELKGAA